MNILGLLGIVIPILTVLIIGLMIMYAGAKDNNKEGWDNGVSLVMCGLVPLAGHIIFMFMVLCFIGAIFTYINDFLFKLFRKS